MRRLSAKGVRIHAFTFTEHLVHAQFFLRSVSAQRHARMGESEPPPLSFIYSLSPKTGPCPSSLCTEPLPTNVLLSLRSRWSTKKGRAASWIAEAALL